MLKATRKPGMGVVNLRSHHTPALLTWPWLAGVLLFSTNRFALPDPVFPLGLTHLTPPCGGQATRFFGWTAKSMSCPCPRPSARHRPDFIGISLRNIDDVNIRKQEVFFQDLPPSAVPCAKSPPAPSSWAEAGSPSSPTGCWN